MSVIQFKQGNFEKLAGALEHAEMFFTWEDRCVMREEAKTAGMEVADLEKNAVGCFCDRLYIANQLAYAYTYGEPCTVQRIDTDNITHNYMSARDLLAELESIRYNIATNGGNTFLGLKDDVRLDRIINTLRGNIIFDRDHNANRPA